MTNATAIGFYRHLSELPSNDEMMSAYEGLEAIVRDLGVEPTYFSAWDGLSRGGWQKYGGAQNRRALEQRLEGICLVGLAANPTGSSQPAYDSFVQASFGYSEAEEQTFLEVVIHEPYLSIGNAPCDSLVNKLAQFWQWDYGFGLERNAGRSPSTFLGGALSRTETPEEKRRIEAWYACYQPEERRKRVRDIFPYNMVGPEHLAHRLPDGRSLREFIEADADSELRPLADNLWLWKVNADRTEAMRDKLRGTGIIIAE